MFSGAMVTCTRRRSAQGPGRRSSAVGGSLCGRTPGTTRSYRAAAGRPHHGRPRIISSRAIADTGTSAPRPPLIDNLRESSCPVAGFSVGTIIISAPTPYPTDGKYNARERADRRRMIFWAGKKSKKKKNNKRNPNS